MRALYRRADGRRPRPPLAGRCDPRRRAGDGGRSGAARHEQAVLTHDPSVEADRQHPRRVSVWGEPARHGEPDHRPPARARRAGIGVLFRALNHPHRGRRDREDPPCHRDSSPIARPPSTNSDHSSSITDRLGAVCSTSIPSALAAALGVRAANERAGDDSSFIHARRPCCGRGRSTTVNTSCRGISRAGHPTLLTGRVVGFGSCPPAESHWVSPASGCAAGQPAAGSWHRGIDRRDRGLRRRRPVHGSPADEPGQRVS